MYSGSYTSTLRGPASFRAPETRFSPPLAGLVVLLALPACDLLMPNPPFELLVECGEARSLADSLMLPPPPEHARTRNDQWAEIARQIPGGWGGFFVRDGEPTIYLVDPDREDDAVAALYEFGVGLPLFDIRTSQILKGRWDFEQLYDWYRYINARVWGPVDGLVMSAIDVSANRLRYGVQESGRDTLESVLTAMELPCDLALVEIREPIGPADR